MLEELKADLLVIGGGGAGLFCVLHAYQSNPNLKIVLVAKGLVGQSGCTRMVQGGFNAVLDSQDSLERHFMDTLKGGAFINNQELAWGMVSEAPKIIRELERLGCFFDRKEDGTIYQKAFAGQSFDRTVHRGDLTGIEIMTRLKEQVLGIPVTLLDEYRAVELFNDGNGGVGGALLLDLVKGELLAVSAKATVVATGGGARMYRIAAPSLEKSGDGMALCYRAGCVMRDMEMYQFHPTGIIAGDSILTGAVLEEGLRGAGARLYNAQGERYMARYDPEHMERATRDIVARASFLEILEGRSTPRGSILLDISHLGADFVEKTFPGMVLRCREAGFDLAREPVEVSPTAHFHMGGACIDTKCYSGIEGLFVAGEDAGGVHGANRLGGNGVAESTVFGALCGDAVAQYVQNRRQPDLDGSQFEEALADLTSPLGGSGDENIYTLRREIEELMWEKVGLVREGKGLMEALERLEEISERVQRVSVPGHRQYNLAWQEYLNVRSILTVAKLTALSALERTESRASHYRTDYPDRQDDRWLKSVQIQQSLDGQPRIRHEPVRLTHHDPRQS